tara:strand:+ start:403 stop:1263 length:861 start_codon:yes stop_codon:yes gene_type:complete
MYSSEDGFCFIHANDEEFESNQNDVAFTEIEERNYLWTPENYIGRDGKQREFGYVTYKVLNSSRSFPDDTFEKTALTVALRTWGFRTKKIRFKRERDPNKIADITLKFARKEDDEYFRTKPSVLAYAYYPTSSAIGGDITFNDDYLWSVNGDPMTGKEAKEKGLVDPRTDDSVQLKTFNIIHTLTHECGHAIGLKHQTVCKECVMYPYYNGKVRLHDLGDRDYYVNGIRTSLTHEKLKEFQNMNGVVLEPAEQAHDVDRIQGLYGKRGISTYIIDYFRRRVFRRYG